MTPMATKSLTAIGLDIGGTTVVGAVVRDDGKILSRATIPTNSRSGIRDGLDRISALLRDLVAQARLQMTDVIGVGVGSTGSINTAEGCIHNPYTLPGWDDFPLGPHITETLGLSSYVLGDCDVAVLGEHWMGAGRGTRNMIYITVGTGIGSGIIINDALYRGAHSAACEFGHHTIDINGPECYCGARGCIEVVCSGPAIAKLAVEAAKRNPSTLMRTLAQQADTEITARQVCEAAGAGDAEAQAIVRFIGNYFGEGLANVMNMIAPECVVLGGGVMQSFDLFAPYFGPIMQRRESVVKLTRIPILPAALKLNAGVMGAARAMFLQIGLAK